mmetsp:Transcript_15113/g.32823  ORF Transcript_15113/g.32823 Transcript_15113/m.32823 type:complete len:364 (-) Transcript_15113:74-1165(-)
MAFAHRQFVLFLCLACAEAVPSFGTNLETDEVTHQWVFQTNASWVYTHMSTITNLDDDGKELLVAFQASGVGEGNKDQHILGARSSDGGSTWGAAFVLVPPYLGKYPVWGPVLQRHENGTIYLFYSRSGAFNDRGDNRNFPGGDILVATTSADLSQPWTHTEILKFTDRGNISKVTANKPAVLRSGRWILPIWREAHTANDTGTSCASTIISDDGGASFQGSDVCLHNNETWLIENAVADSSAGLVMVFRSTSGFIWESTSQNNGDTWTVAEPTTLPNPNSKVCMYLSKTADQLVVTYNPSATSRSPLAMASSSRGSSWTEDKTLVDTGVSEYPTSLQIGDTVLTTYSADTKKGIKLAFASPP